MLTLTKEPEFIEAVYNRIEFQFSKRYYKVGDRAFCEIYQVQTENISDKLKATDGKILTTLSISGRGNGSFSFDISSVLQYLFAGYTVPDASLPFLKDTSAYAAYYVKAGILSFSGTTQSKEYTYTSKPKYALRAALTPDKAKDLGAYTANYLNQASYLTNMPEGTQIRPGQNSPLSLLLLDDAYAKNRKLNLVADKFYRDGTSRTGEIVTSAGIGDGGVFTFNVSPALVEPDPVKRLSLSAFTVYVDYTTEGVMSPYDRGYELGRYDGASLNYNLPPCEVGMTAAECESFHAGYKQGYADSEAIYNIGLSKGLSDSRYGLPINDSCQLVGGGFSNGFSAGFQTGGTSVNYTGIDCTAYQNGYNAGYALEYTATYTHFTTCGLGYEWDEAKVTVTVVSKISQEDANTRARTAAMEQAQAELVCVPLSTLDPNPDPNPEPEPETPEPTQEQITAAYNEGHLDGFADSSHGYGHGNRYVNDYTTAQEQAAYVDGYDTGFDAGFLPDEDGDPTTKG